VGDPVASVVMKSHGDVRGGVRNAFGMYFEKARGFHHNPVESDIVVTVRY